MNAVVPNISPQRSEIIQYLSKLITIGELTSPKIKQHKNPPVNAPEN